LRQQATRLGIESDVIFAGRVPHAEVQRFYDQIDVLAYPRHRMRLTDLVTPLKPLTQAGIEQAVSAQQADAVLATILVSDQQSDVEGGDRDTRGGDYFKAEGTGYAPDFWGLYGVPVVYGQFEDLPPIYTLEGTVEVQTRVYDTRSHAMVRTVKTKAKHLESSDQAAAAITEELGKQLRREGVVR
jgi:hypothetical protein